LGLCKSGNNTENEYFVTAAAIINHARLHKIINNYSPLKRIDFLEQMSSLATRKRTSEVRLTRNAKIFKTIIRAIQQKKGEYIVSLDLRKIPEAVADFFIICQAGSTTQVKAISDFVEDYVRKECGEQAFRHEGQKTAQWVLIDYVNVVVHIMHPETRKFYKLEEMWSDGPLTEHNDK
jgi:ribosome-associated protein